MESEKDDVHRSMQQCTSDYTVNKTLYVNK